MNIFLTFMNLHLNMGYNFVQEIVHNSTDHYHVVRKNLNISNKIVSMKKSILSLNKNKLIVIYVKLS